MLETRIRILTRIPVVSTLLCLTVQVRMVSFSYAPSSKFASVYVVGTFNGWDKTSAPMRLDSDGKTWRTKLKIEPGIYQYLFVEDGKRWVPDPTAKHVADGNGNRNSVLVVQPPAFDRNPGVKGDGVITLEAIRHRSNRSDTIRLDENEFGFNLRVRAGDVERVWLQIDGKRWPAHLIDSNDLYEIWRANITIAPNKRTYRWILEDGSKEIDWPESPLSQDLAKYPLPSVPDWVADQVFYQIFPDRFQNGDPSNDGAGAQPWGSKPTGTNRMGGDLTGVRSKLDYIQELGATAILFNPLFVAGSNHGYDIFDYERIDPRFGSNDDFKELVRELKQRKMRVLLDGVFNHSGVEFFAFKSLRELGPKSPYQDWYTTYRFPLKVADGQRTYRAWFGVTSLPRLKTEAAPVRRYFYKVASDWIARYGIDGWRLDAADQVGHPYWRGFRAAVKAANPDAWILTEIWGDCHESLQGDESDNQMNYRWRSAVHAFFGADAMLPSEFQRQLSIARDDVPRRAWNTQLNLLGSHDTERFRTLFNGDLARQRQAVLFQMTYPGVPSVYYGDEVGLEGGKDPDCRRCMPWDEVGWDHDLRDWTRAAIGFRQSHSSARRGNFQLMICDDRSGAYGYVREHQGSKILVLFSKARPAKLKLPPGRWRLAIGSAIMGSESVEVPAFGCAAFESVRN